MAVGESYQGGLAFDGRAPGAGDNRYRNWVAYEVSPTQNITIAYVTGQVEVANPGIKAKLSYVPNDLNPNILLLRINFIQRPGVWPEVLTWIMASYAGALVDDGPFKEAQVVSGEVIVVTVPFYR
jgi:hypothetical protein